MKKTFNIKHIAFLLLCAFVFSFGFTSAQEQVKTLDETTQIAEEYGTLSGTILAKGATGERIKIYIQDKEGEVIESTTSIFATGSATYDFGKIPTGVYKIYTDSKITINGISYAGIDTSITIKAGEETISNHSLSTETDDTVFKVVINGPVGAKVSAFMGNHNDYKSTNVILDSSGMKEVSFSVEEGVWFVGVGSYEGGGDASTEYLFPDSRDVLIKGSKCYIEQSTLCYTKFKLEVPQNKLKGHVADKDGKKIANARIAVHNIRENTQTSSVSDISGNFELNLPEGVYVVSANAKGILPSDETTIEITSDGKFLLGEKREAFDLKLMDYSDFRITLPLGEYILSGKVLDSDGNGVEGGVVLASRTDSNESIKNTTSSNGSYVLYVNPGEWKVSAFVPEYGTLAAKTVQVDGLVRDVDFLVEKEEEARFDVSGSVSVGSNKLENASISAVGNINGDRRFFNAKTDSSGKYVLSLPAGKDYKIFAYHSDYGEFKEITNLDIEGNLSNQDFSKKETHSVKVKFYEGESLRTVNKAFVEFRSEQGGRSLIIKNGNEGVVDLSEGKYNVYVYMEGIPSEKLKTINSSKINTINVSSDTTYKIYFPELFNLSGYVMSGNDSVSGAWIELVSLANGSKQATSSDENGRYSLNLTEGDYKVYVSRNGYAPYSEKIEISEDSSESFNLIKNNLAINGNISASDAFYSKAIISAKNVDTGATVATRSLENGTYELQLSPGSYVVSAALDGYKRVKYPYTIEIFSSDLDDIDFYFSNKVSLSEAEAQSVDFSEGGSFVAPNSKVRLSLDANAASSGGMGSFEVKETSAVVETSTSKPLGNVGKEITLTGSDGSEIKSFNKEVNIEMNYSKAELDEAFGELGEDNPTLEMVKTFKLSYWDETLGAWVELPSTVSFYPTNADSYSDLRNDDSGNAIYVSGSTKHFSLFSVAVSNLVVTSESEDGTSLASGVQNTVSELAEILGEATQTVRVASDLGLDDVISVSRNGENISLNDVFNEAAENASSNSEALFAFAIGDTISTNSNGIADINLGGFTRMILDKNSKVEITEANENKMIYNQEEGRVGYEFNKQETDMNWEVNTSTVNATIRGTTVLFDLSGENEVYSVLEGTINLLNKTTNQTYNLNKGDNLIVMANGESYLEGEVSTTSSTFNDVSSSDWFAPYVEALKTRNIIEGYSGNYFKPGSLINRAEAVKIVLLASGESVEENISSIDFNDVSSSDWFAPYVLIAKNKEIVGGYEDGSFRPGNNITRAEALKIILLAAGTNISNKFSSSSLFVDTPSDAWYAPYTAYAKSNNIVGGYEDGSFRPNASITRSEFAKMVSIIYGFTN